MGNKRRLIACWSPNLLPPTALWADKRSDKYNYDFCECLKRCRSGLLFFFLLLALFFLGGCGSDGGPTPTTNSVRVDSASELPSGLVLSPVSGAESVLLFPRDLSRRGYFCILRKWKEDELEIIENCAERPLSVDFSRSFSQTSVVQEIFEDGETLVLAIYDPELNIPQGTSSSGSENDSISLYRIGRSSRVELLAKRVPVSPLDSPIYFGKIDDGFGICDYSQCFSVSNGAFARLGVNSSGRDLVEVSFDADGAVAISRDGVDRAAGAAITGAGFQLLRLRRGSEESVDIPSACIPFALDGVTQSYRCAYSKQDFFDLINYEIEKFNNNGRMFFGASNREGRLPWSQHYYLTAFTSLLSGRPSKIADVGDWSALRSRTCQEIALMARRSGQDLSGYYSKRYSLERSSLLFALHLGRIGTVLSGYAKIGCPAALAPDISQISLSVGRALSDLQSTVEEPVAFMDSTLGLIEALRYKSAVRFWADGVNVPYNYVSGTAVGAVDLARDHLDRERIFARYGAFFRYMYRSESLGSARTWSYWWGRGYSGWTAKDGVSFNTPAFAGMASKADITYRAMDAVAIISFLEVLDPADRIRALDNIRRLVSDGGLSPDVNDSLSKMGSEALISPVARLHYSRAAAPSELGSLIWALNGSVPD